MHIMDCVCIRGYVVCVHIWNGVYAYRGCVCAYGVMCVCMHYLVRRFLMFLWCCSFLSGQWLILCPAVAGTAEPVPSYQAG